MAQISEGAYVIATESSIATYRLKNIPDKHDVIKVYVTRGSGGQAPSPYQTLVFTQGTRDTESTDDIYVEYDGDREFELTCAYGAKIGTIDYNGTYILNGFDGTKTKISLAEAVGEVYFTYSSLSLDIEAGAYSNVRLAGPKYADLGGKYMPIGIIAYNFPYELEVVKVYLATGSNGYSVDIQVHNPTGSAITIKGDGSASEHYVKYSALFYELDD
jgi:hypothetical protein